MKIFVPIKEVSQRVPRKNFRLFGGISLYKHTLYKLSDFSVFVDTDSDEILNEIITDKKLSHVTAYKRNPNLVGHEISVCKLIKNFVKRFEINNEVVCQLHVTSPFLSCKTLKDAAKKINNGYDSVISCNTLQTRLWRQETYGMCPINHNPMNLEQTQDLPLYYEENSLFYIFNSDDIMKTGNRIGITPYFYITNFPENLDIDTEENWSLAEKVNIQ